MRDSRHDRGERQRAPRRVQGLPAYRRASCSVCPGEDRAASTPKIAAMTRLTPRRMSVAGMDSTKYRSASHPVASANARTTRVNIRAMTTKAARRPYRAQAEQFGVERKPKQINASHGAAPHDRRRSPAGKRRAD